MEVDERLIKQLADIFSVQNQIAIEQDIDRRLDEIRDLYEELIGVSEYKRTPYMHISNIMRNQQCAYENVSEKLFVIKERICKVEEKFEKAKLDPEYKKAVDTEIKDIKKTYFSWKSKCRKALIDERAYGYDKDGYEHYIGRLELTKN